MSRPRTTSVGSAMDSVRSRPGTEMSEKPTPPPRPSTDRIWTSSDLVTRGRNVTVTLDDLVGNPTDTWLPSEKRSAADVSRRGPVEAVVSATRLIRSGRLKSTRIQSPTGL